MEKSETGRNIDAKPERECRILSRRPDSCTLFRHERQWPQPFVACRPPCWRSARPERKHLRPRSREGATWHENSFFALPLPPHCVEAAFVQRRYGWKFGVPAYVLATYVGWSRTYAKKHDWWDVVTGAAIGAGSSYIFTRPFAKKHNLAMAPVSDGEHFGITASFNF